MFYSIYSWTTGIFEIEIRFFDNEWGFNEEFNLIAILFWYTLSSS